MKLCSKCNKVQPFSEFSIRRASKDGLVSQCKSCVREYYESHRVRKFDPLIFTDTEKQCRICNELKSFDNFDKSNGRLHSYCKDCAREKYHPRTTKKMIVTDTHKQCRKCDSLLPKEEFSVSATTGKLSTYCISCHKAYSRKKVITKHGLSLELYNKILTEQNNKCKICDSSDKLHIDHDHSHCDKPYGCSECVRGLICANCNRALGLAKDSTDILSKMIKYLNDFSEK